MKIYLAGAWDRIEELRVQRDRIRDLGHVVTSRWLDGFHPFAPRDVPILAARCAGMDTLDLRACETLVVLSGGGDVEFGMARVYGKRLMLVGDPVNVFHALACVETFPSWDALLEELEGYEP